MSESNGAATPVAYAAPELVLLGSVNELTLGSTGSVMDNNGRGTHGKARR